MAPRRSQYLPPIFAINERFGREVVSWSIARASVGVGETACIGPVLLRATACRKNPAAVDGDRELSILWIQDSPAVGICSRFWFKEIPLVCVPLP